MTALETAHIDQRMDPVALCLSGRWAILGFRHIFVRTPCHLTDEAVWGMSFQYCSGCVFVCVCEFSLSLLAQMSRLNPSPAVLRSIAKLEHLAPD